MALISPKPGRAALYDETSLSHGELYTIVTNNAAKGKKGVIAAIVAGTKSRNRDFRTAKNSGKNKEEGKRNYLGYGR